MQSAARTLLYPSPEKTQTVIKRSDIRSFKARRERTEALTWAQRDKEAAEPREGHPLSSVSFGGASGCEEAAVMDHRRSVDDRAGLWRSTPPPSGSGPQRPLPDTQQTSRAPTARFPRSLFHAFFLVCFSLLFVTFEAAQNLCFWILPFHTFLLPIFSSSPFSHSSFLLLIVLLLPFFFPLWVKVKVISETNKPLKWPEIVCSQTPLVS